jgi:single-stranded-DNA-specific exonuclease
MLQPRANWKIGEPDIACVQKLTQSLGIDPLLAKLLVNRGIVEEVEARAYLQTDVTSFHDPFRMDGMDHAVRRIRLAIETGEFIRIYGDYDADGVSSTTLMVYLFRELGAHFDWYIPHRVHEGYGLNRKAIELSKENGVKLLLTVDTGISAVDEVHYANELGIDVIVTDHHEPPDHLPHACAIINPKKPGCPYPFKGLAGVGVAFKLAQALLGRVPEELLEIATIGTVADLMPLQGENRAIVRLGLERMRKSAYAGIRALFRVGGIEASNVSASQVGFALAPRINASGRLDGAGEAVRLLTTDNEQEAAQLAFQLDALNKERQRIVEDIIVDAYIQAKSKQDRHVLVIAAENWNVGVIGIVASKLLEKYYCPTIVLSIDPVTGMAKGSARSISGFDLHKALTHCSEWLEHYGGHQAAAGMTLRREYIPDLERKLIQLAKEWLTDDDYVPVMHADLSVSLHDVQINTIQMLEQLAPFGMGNPTPKFVFQSLHIGDIRTMGKDQQHIKLQLLQTVKGPSVTLDAIGFGRGNVARKLSTTSTMDVFGELSINEWNGIRKLQLTIQDLGVPHLQVFDWRGAHDVQQRWQSVVESVDDTGEDQHRKSAFTIVVFREVDARQLPAHLLQLGCSIWVAESHTEISESSFDHCQDLLIWTMPPSLELFQEMLQKARAVQRVYAYFQTNSDSDSTIPTRDQFKYIYGELLQLGALDIDNVQQVESFSRRSGLSRSVITFMLEVFAELEFLQRHGSVYRFTTKPVKRELTSSNVYQIRLARQQAERELVYSTGQSLTELIRNMIRQDPN